MPIFETFARRKAKQTRTNEQEIYSYDLAPAQMRHQICQALAEGLGRYVVIGEFSYSVPENANDLWEQIDRVCRKELFSYLDYRSERNLANKFLNYINIVKDMDDFLSALEIGCLFLSVMNDTFADQPERRGALQTGQQSIEEINGRFEQHGVGYQFETGQIIRVDSKIVHAEITKPALRLLTAPMFAKAQEEFMTAHRHYRADEYKDCVTASNRAYESGLKAICDAERWVYGKGDRASDLVTRVTNNGLFSHDFDQSFSAYVAMLKAGLPVVRNNAGGHGEGVAGSPVTPEIARFALNMTAVNIVFLGEAYLTFKGIGIK